MKLTAIIHLTPSDDQRQALLHTLERANAACNWISGQAWEVQRFGRAPVHEQTYYAVREQFGLSAQLAVRCVAKVVDAYKADRKVQRRFHPSGAIPFDDRILSWDVQTRRVSIWTLVGRLSIAFVAGERQLELLASRCGESDLVYRRGEFYLYATCDVPAAEPIDPNGFLGCDMGIKNILTDSDGTIYSAKHLLNVRHRHRRLRKKLQRKGTKSAKRRLKHLSGKEKRFANDTNHCLSKQVVKKAQGTGRAIALEDLMHIRTRATVKKPKRDDLHTWAFADLQSKIAYKAKRAGIPVQRVDARYTSQQCSCCGHTSRSNRPNQSTFKCVSCGFASHADTNAALNIQRRAAVNPPYAVCVLGANPATTASLRALAPGR